MHHPLLDGTGLVPASLQRGDLGVHVGEDDGDGGLLIFVARNTETELLYLFRVRGSKCTTLLESLPTPLGMDQSME